MCCPTSGRARDSRRTTRSRSMRRPTIALVLWESPCVRRYSRAPANSSRRPRRPASRAVTTMDATAAARRVWCRFLQTNTRQGKRSSTYRAFLEGEAERRPNLTIITGAQATACSSKVRPDSGSNGHRVSQCHRRERVALATQGSDLERRRSRFAPLAAAVRHRPATRTRNDWRSVSRRFAPCRQALEGSPSCAPVLPGAGSRCLDG